MKQARSSTSNFKYLLRILIFLLCVAAAGRLVGRRYQRATAFNVINAFTQTRFQDFYALPPDTLDMVFIGSSHSYCTFDPANFPQAESFQMGTPLQHIDTAYYSLLNILDHQSPSTVVLEVYWDMLDDDFDLKQASSFFEVLDDKALQEQYIREVFPLAEKVKYGLTPIRYQQDYFSWQASELAKELEAAYGVSKPAAEAANGVEYYLEKGYVYCDIVLPESEYDETNQFKGLDGKDWEMSKVQRKYLQKIVDLCRDRGMRLVFVTAPIALVSMDYIENYDVIHQTVADFAAENQVPYIDYNLLDLGLTNDNFRDDAHLNDSGVKIVDEHFRNWLLEIDEWQ